MYLCIVDDQATVRLHRRIPRRRETFLQGVAPYRDDLVVCVERIFSWYWLADLCLEHEIHSVLGAKLGRPTYFMLNRNQTFDMERFLRN